MNPFRWMRMATSALGPPRLRIPRKDLGVRLYAPADFDQCVAVYAGNERTYLPTQRELFETFLSEDPRNYLVVTERGVPIACGGITVFEGTQSLQRSPHSQHIAEMARAALSFGMVARERHRKGIGGLLLLARLAMIDPVPTIISMETSLATMLFYGRYGFLAGGNGEQRYENCPKHLDMFRWAESAERRLARSWIHSLGISVAVDFDAISRRPLPKVAVSE